MYFASDQQIRIPTQLYSSALLFIIFIVLLIVSEKPHRQGEIFFLYLLLYAVKRFGIEFFRADNTAVLFGLTLFQVLSIAVFFIAVINLILIKRGKT